MRSLLAFLLMGDALTFRANFAAAPWTSARSTAGRRRARPVLLATTEEAAAAAARLTPAKVAALDAWLDENGCTRAKVVPGVADAAHGGGVGLRLASGQRASKGDVLATVPFSLCFTADSARASEVGSYLEEFFEDGWTGAAGMIAVQLMHELRLGPAQSKWGPWLALLPGVGGEAGGLDLPLFWPPEDLAHLEGVSTRPIAELGNEADEDFAWLEEKVFGAHRDVFPAEHFGREQWRYALGLALSRSFFLGGATRLVPFLDLVNHDDDVRVELSSSSEAGGVGGVGGGIGALGRALGSVVGGGKAARLVADRAYDAGDEVCVSYGVRTAAEYLEEHGFVPFFNSAAVAGAGGARGADLSEGLWGSGQLAELTFALEEGVTRCHDDKADVLEEAGLDVQATFEVREQKGNFCE